MKRRDLAKIGIPAGRCAEAAKQILQHAHTAKRSTATVLNDLGRVAAAPAAFLADTACAGLAQLLIDRAGAEGTFVPREIDAPYQIWGEDLEPNAVQQLKNACKLPVAVSGALMPGTSGSGNHFVEFGRLTVFDDAARLSAGEYFALLSHSGSRGTGAQIAQHHSRLARELHPELPQELSQLAWLDLSTEAGQEYWAAMELMGRYAAANHALIHAYMARALGVEVLLDIENHHNFLRERGVTLLSAGLDEVPMAYKDIDQVMAAQSDLVEALARFEPRLVKMAPSGEPPEDWRLQATSPQFRSSGLCNKSLQKVTGCYTLRSPHRGQIDAAA